ncbi:NPCBM/NEW2 domain-containing protein [Micromonospora sp. ATA32]|nr:NPCBM/NEW2 domain-containing protein [Micromonospora sp. ATA32]
MLDQWPPVSRLVRREIVEYSYYSEIQLDLGGACTRFQSDAGVDDEVTGGSVRFRVLGDGVMLWQSPVLTRPSASLRADVNVTGVDDLRLIVDDGGDGNGQDHADWAGAWLHCAA